MENVNKTGTDAEKGREILRKAIREGNIEKVKKYIHYSAPGCMYQRKALAKAAERGHMRIFQMQHQWIPPISRDNRWNHETMSALLRGASFAGQTEIVNLLLAPLDNKEFEQTLRDGGWNDYLVVTPSLLFDQRLNEQKRYDIGQWAMGMATRHGHLGSVKELLKVPGIGPPSLGDLHWAVGKGRAQVLEVLLNIDSVLKAVLQDSRLVEFIFQKADLGTVKKLVPHLWAAEGEPSSIIREKCLVVVQAEPDLNRRETILAYVMGRLQAVDVLTLVHPYNSPAWRFQRHVEMTIWKAMHVLYRYGLFKNLPWDIILDILMYIGVPKSKGFPAFIRSENGKKFKRRCHELEKERALLQ